MRWVTYITLRCTDPVHHWLCEAWIGWTGNFLLLSIAGIPANTLKHLKYNVNLNHLSTLSTPRKASHSKGPIAMGIIHYPYTFTCTLSQSHIFLLIICIFLLIICFFQILSAFNFQLFKCQVSICTLFTYVLPIPFFKHLVLFQTIF